MYENHASLHKRVVASTIDLLLIIFVLTPIMNIVEKLVYKGRTLPVIIEELATAEASSSVQLVDVVHRMQMENFFFNYLVVQIIAFSLIGVILVVMWSRFGVTPGKWLLGCRLVQAQSYGPLTVPQALVRFLGYGLSILSFGAGLFMAMFTKDKRCLHDKISRTVVINVPHDFSLFERIRNKLLRGGKA
jgi:uncharacterized RDD family membrane protein YckC